MTTDLSSAIAPDEFKGMTIARMIVDLVLMPIETGTGALVGIGTVLLSDEAVAVGAFPEPEVGTDQAGWLWRTVKTVHTSTSNDRSQATAVVHDLRGRRRWPGEDFALMLIVTNFAGVINVNIDGMVRTLVWKP